MTEIAEIRDQILTATLSHVMFDGWTRRALDAGAKDAGFGDALTGRAFPGGVKDLTKHYFDYANRRMLAELANRNLDELPVRERIATAIRIRLEQQTPDREAIRRLLSHLALPGRHALAIKAAFKTVDAIWYAAGDQSTDFNYYSKRALLAGVYTSTILYWLSDHSEGLADTWAFLDRRIEDSLSLPKISAKMKRKIEKLPSPFRLLRLFRQRPV